MVRRNNEKPLPSPMLLISREQASDKIARQIELGRELKQRQITSLDELKNVRSDFYTWDDFNEELLSRIFDNPSIRDGYRMSIGIAHSGDRPIAELVQELKDDIDFYLRRLLSIQGRLELITISPSVSNQLLPLTIKQNVSKNVFIVHGHDEMAKEAVARFIQKLGLKPIILNEQPNAGRTIIEKFEGSSENVGYAVVLLTPEVVLQEIWD